MQINYLTDKNCYLTCSEYSESNPVDLFSNSFVPRNFIEWNLDTPRETAWIKYNAVYIGQINSYSFIATGSCAKLSIKTSLDNRNWETLYTIANIVGGESFSFSFDLKDFIFFMIDIETTTTAFSIKNLTITGNAELYLTDKWISPASSRLYPQAFYENNNLIPEFVTDYIKMIETGSDLESSRNRIDPNLILDFLFSQLYPTNIGEITGAINAQMINKTEIDGRESFIITNNYILIDIYPKLTPTASWGGAFIEWSFSDSFTYIEGAPQDFVALVDDAYITYVDSEIIVNNPSIIVSANPFAKIQHIFDASSTIPYVIKATAHFANGNILETIKNIQF